MMALSGMITPLGCGSNFLTMRYSAGHKGSCKNLGGGTTVHLLASRQYAWMRRLAQTGRPEIGEQVDWPGE